MKVELPDGAWADIRDPRKLSERLTAQLEDAQLALVELPAAQQFATPEDFEKIQDLPPFEQIKLVGRDGFKVLREMKWTSILVYVTEWSFGAVTRDVLLDDVPSSAAGVLSQEIEKIIKATGGPHLNTEPSPDSQSPMPPSQS